MRGLILLIILSSSFILPVSAEEAAEKDTQHNVDAYVRYIPSRNADAQPGGIEIIESEGEYSYEFKAFAKLPVKVSLANRYISIENSTQVELPSHLTGLIADIETTLPFFGIENTYLRIGVSPSFYGDDWNFTSSNFRIPSRYIGIYKPSEQLILLAGIAVYPDFENEALPVLGLIYKPNERLSFNLTPRRPNISYALNKKATLFTEFGRAFNGEFEVDKDNLKNVILKYKQTQIGAGLKYKFNELFSGSFAVGGVFNRSLEYENSLGKVSIKSGVYTELRFLLEI
ncbi:MAG: hypothetical protein AB1481_01945 [Candidatus Omnitrophota bacterium]